MRTFLKGLKEPLGSLMRTKDPKSLNDALNVLTNDFQIDASSNPYANASVSHTYKDYKSNNTQNNKHSNPNRYVPPVFRQSNPSGGNNQFNPNRFNNQQPRFNYNNHNQWRQSNGPQQSNNSGPSKQNVWNKPAGQPFKSTPMSAQTTRSNNFHYLESDPSEETVPEDYNQDNEEYNPEDTESHEDFCLGASENQQI